MDRCLMFADLFDWLSLDRWLTILQVAFGLGMVIFVHELGHFLIAKLCGVKCEKFYVGFDAPIKIWRWQLPRTLGKFQWGETEYGIGIIPLGGYVKMLGQDDNPANYQQESDRIKVGDQPEDSQAESPQVGDNSSANDEQEIQLDPRSYPAKPVLSRMCIISAGVVMNVIFAAIFATVAFRVGTSYTPCLIGSAIPGYSAWEAGLEPGDRIIQLGREEKPNDQLRFHQDLQSKVLFSGVQQEIEFLIRRGEEETWVPLRPTNSFGDSSDPPKIGVSPLYTNVLLGNIFDQNDDQNSQDISPQDSRTTLQSGDCVVAVDGQPVSDGLDLQRLLAEKPNDDLLLTVERHTDDGDESPEILEIPVPSRPLRRLGLVMRLGPITGVRSGSPAAGAGLQKGDLIKSFNGQPVGDPLDLSEELRRLAGQQIDLEVLRDGSSHHVQLTPRQPTTTPLYRFNMAMPVVAESIGVVYVVEGLVDDVVSDSPAQNAGIQAGDEIIQVTFVPAENEPAERKLERRQTGSLDPVEINEENPNWPYVFARMQYVRPETSLQIKYRRGKDEPVMTETLMPVELDEWSWKDRGLVLETVKEPLQVNNWNQALAMGLEQTWDDLTKVITVLRKIVTGGISPMNLGGPAMIVAAAGSEASQGMGRFLLFLTLLSANLAVINFLPIPVLDGGHMMFLAYEGVTGKPVNERIQFQLTLVGLALILMLMVFVIGLDIKRFAEWFL